MLCRIFPNTVDPSSRLVSTFPPFDDLGRQVRNYELNRYPTYKAAADRSRINAGQNGHSWLDAQAARYPGRIPGEISVLI